MVHREGKMVVITYGDRNFKNQKKRILKSALQFGFMTIQIYGPKDISMEFKKNTTPYIKAKRGGGYWLWKAYIIHKVFQEIENGDIVLYLDAGFHINQNGKKRFNEYIKFMDLNKGILSFSLKGLVELEWTNLETLKYFNLNETNEIVRLEQLIAGILMFRKNKVTSELIKDFYDIALKNPNLFSDEFNYGINETFKEHRHDQSILSILRKKYNINSLQDETWDNDFNNLNHTPFHALRLRDENFINLFRSNIRNLIVFIKKKIIMNIS